MRVCLLYDACSKREVLNDLMWAHFEGKYINDHKV